MNRNNIEYQKELALLFNFLAEKAKNATSPIGNYQLAKEFKESTGSLPDLNCLTKRVHRCRLNLETKHDLDMDTRVKMLFVMGAELSEKLLRELSQNAEIELDQHRRIVKYKQNKEGGLVLYGVHPLKGKKARVSGNNSTLCSIEMNDVGREYSDADSNATDSFTTKSGRVTSKRHLDPSFVFIPPHNEPESSTRTKRTSETKKRRESPDLALDILRSSIPFLQNIEPENEEPPTHYNIVEEPITPHKENPAEENFVMKQEPLDYGESERDDGKQIAVARYQPKYRVPTTQLIPISQRFIARPPTHLLTSSDVSGVSFQMHQRLLTSIQSLMPTLELPLPERIQKRIEGTIQKIARFERLGMNDRKLKIHEIDIAFNACYLIVTKQDVLNPFGETRSLQNFLLLLRNALVSSKLLLGFQQKLKRVIEELSVQDKRISVERALSAMRTIIDIVTP